MLDGLLARLSRVFKGKLTINNLLYSTPLAYKQRSLNVGSIIFIGYKYNIKPMNLMAKLKGNLLKIFKGKSVVPTVWLEMHFDVQSATNKRVYYRVIVEVPFRKGIEKMRFRDLPIKFYCQCDSFKYTLAYSLNKLNCLYLNTLIQHKLGVAIKQRPAIKNPKEIGFFCKHTYKLITLLDKLSVVKILNSRKYISPKIEGMIYNKLRY